MSTATKLPRLGKRRKVYQNQYHQIYRVRADFGSFAKEYFVSDYGERVGLVIWRGDEILLVSQYRLLIHRDSWEVPGGRVDRNESPKQAAAREGLEETGLRCRGLKPLLYVHPGLDTFHNPTHIFHTNQFSEAPPGSLHKREVNGRKWVPLAKCLDMIFAGQITDSLSVASLLAFYAMKTRGGRSKGLFQNGSVVVPAAGSRTVPVRSRRSAASRRRRNRQARTPTPHIVSR